MFEFLENGAPENHFVLPLSMEASEELDWLTDTVQNMERDINFPDR
jgi:hypothetical protein